MHDPLPQGGVGKKQVRERERRQHEQSLEHLGEEREPEGHTHEREPAPATPGHGAHGEVGGRGHEQHQERIRVIEAEHECCRGSEGEDASGDQAARRAELPAVADETAPHGSEQ